MPSRNNNAYVTLLTSDSYLPGALVLASSLRATVTRNPLIVLVPENALSQNSLAALDEAYDRIVTVPLLRSSDAGNLELLGRTDLDVTFTKLHVFNPATTGAERVVFLDADVMITRNVDALFDYLTDDVQFAAAPDIGWPDCFNSGVIALRPSVELFQGLVRQAATTGSFDGGDQGVLNEFFSGWSGGLAAKRGGGAHIRTGRLPFTYNVTPTSFYSYLPALKHFQNDISAVHFIGAEKPWMGKRESDAFGGPGGPMQQFLNRWWNFYDAVKHILNRSSGAQTNASSSRPVVQHNNWTSSGSQTTSHAAGGGSGGGSTLSADAAEFSNYRVAWDMREASPVRSTFSMTPTPFIVTYRTTHNGASDASFFGDVEPTALFPNAEEDLTPVSPDNVPAAGAKRRPSFAEFEKEVSQHYVDSGPPPMDLGNYRIGWNQDELGPAAQIPQTLSTGPHDTSNELWATLGADSSKLPSVPPSDGTPSVSGQFSDSEDADDVEQLDDRVWNEDADQEDFVRSLKVGRARSSSANSARSHSSSLSGKPQQHHQAQQQHVPVHSPTSQQQSQRNKGTAQSALV